MTADPAFRLSTYLSLALACVALGVAEAPILPEVGGFAAVVVLAVAVVYRLEGRVELLSVSAANNLGIVIALAGAGWAAVRITRETRVGEFASVGWAVFVVLLLVPVLMALLVALLARREKNAEVYWYLHAGALASVVFAAALSRRPREVVLVAAYAAVAVWGLARFALARGGAAPAGRAGAGAAAAAGLVAAAALVALPVFGLTPASPFEKWDLGPGRIDVGFSAAQTVDLTRTGRLGGGDDVAFEVDADQDGRPKDDLPPDTRWRGRLLAHYQNGAWRREAALKLPEVQPRAKWADPWHPPDLGPGEYRLRFTVPGSLRNAFLAEPVVWSPGQPPPVADVFAPPTPPRAWLPLSDGTFLDNPTRPDLSPNRIYVQYTAPLRDPDLGVGFEVVAPGDPVLTQNPVPAVRMYADRLVARLVREGKLPPAAEDRDPRFRYPPPAQHEAIARAFSRYLSEDPGFRYTTTLVRPRRDLDPVEEFLEHSKAGHCERFASALVLMLRSQGIPAALVLGFKGYEPAGDGKYLVRQDQAHAWATALVTRPDGLSYWLSLDPSPAASADETGGGAAAKTGWVWVWNHLLDATPEERLRSLARLAAHPAAVGVLAGLAVLAALGWGVRRVRQARAAADRPSAALAPLLAVLARAGFVPASGETPRELAARVEAALAANAGTAAVAGVPPAWVEDYYEERFGGTAPAADRRAARTADLAALRAALAAYHPGGTR